MKVYSIHEASKKLTISPNMLKQWEKSFTDFLIIPRRKSGTRYYTDKELLILHKIKSLYDTNTKMIDIKTQLEMFLSAYSEGQDQTIVENKKGIEIVDRQYENSDVSKMKKEDPIVEQNIQSFLTKLETYKNDLVKEMKVEIMEGIRQELIQPVTNEIKNGATETISVLSEKMNEAKIETKENMEVLSQRIQFAAVHSSSELDAVNVNLKKLAKLSKSERKTYSKQWTSTATSSKEIKSMIEHLSKSNEEINKTMDQLHENDKFLLEAMSKEREQLQEEIRTREINFQELVQSFRQTAATNQRKRSWWNVWKQI